MSHAFHFKQEHNVLNVTLVRRWTHRKQSIGFYNKEPIHFQSISQKMRDITANYCCRAAEQ